MQASGCPRRSAAFPPRSVPPALEAYSKTDLFGPVWTGAELSLRDRALVTFAALMTRHETDTLQRHVTLALDVGVTPAELSETITHLALYTGRGNAIAATEAAAPVFAAHGIAPADLPAVDPDLLPLDEEAEAARETPVRGTFGNVSTGGADTTRKLLFRDLWLRPDLAPRPRAPGPQHGDRRGADRGGPARADNLPSRPRDG
ncbi:carboxymuconolactone decarboxylase family protein [Rhodovulum sp. BSW8]|uniref:carboxymuconolactone decarboxylase family protein n=1 Tax=Rhodovulum sp. BSW8 TaxID=2259645 RepID=UPI001FB1ADD4|nr:carboxymuconolactone decarboxylase family protein [Rhodovulum sp. BSW8]